MNNNPEETKTLLSEIKKGLNKFNCEIIVFVPFVDISEAVEAIENTSIKVGAQNCYFENSGAYTGEVSAQMLKDINVDYVILGHSERREYFFETDELINKKVRSALKIGLKVILCVGETLDEREQGVTAEKVSLQVKKALLGVTKKDLYNVIIAYEPIWAIGTGKTATKENADSVCKIIRKTIASLYGEESACKISVLYGGSMNAKNAKELLSMENIDGGLIGGASLKSRDFLSIIEDTSDF